MNLETKLHEILSGEKKAPFAKSFFYFLSQGYRAGVALRHLAYDYLIPTRAAPAFTISVGNIVAGGTGKTPIVHYLAKRLSEKGRVAILSRGYKRQSKEALIAKEGMGPKELGDEPYWLSQSLPGVEVIVGSDRIFSAHLAQMADRNILLLDDGMQYRRLEKDLEIVVMRASDLFGGGFYLPRGWLRDTPRRLKAAHLILLTGVQNSSQFGRLKATLSRYTDAPVTSMQLQVENGEEIRGKQIASFCAIANPSRFEKTLESLGCDVLKSLKKPDHEPFEEKELRELAKSAPLLVCTEKDAVKLPKPLLDALPIFPLRISYQPQFGKEHLEQIIQEVPQ